VTTSSSDEQNRGATVTDDGRSTVFHNGRIYTADARSPWAEALAIRDARIVAAGTAPDVTAAAGANARVVDLAGRMAMPGIIDMHNHVLEGARGALFELALSPAQSFEAVLQSVKTAADKAPAGQWITGFGWGPAVAESFAKPDSLRRLDAASPRNPVVLRDISYHSRVANSRAIEATGLHAIEAAASFPPEIVRDSAGQPTGLFHETAGAAIDAAAPPWSPEQLAQSARHGVRLLNSLGVTGFNLAVASRATITAFRQLDLAGELTARMAAYIDHRSPLTAQRDGIGPAFIAERAALATKRIDVNFAKFFMDGVPSQRTASVMRAYRDGTAGAQSLYTVDELADLIAPLDKQGMSVKVHAIGDRAIREVLDAIERVRQRNGPGPAHQIAHLNFILDDDIDRMARLNVIADLCPPLWFPSPIHRRLAEVLGQDYVDRSFPIRVLLARGILAAAGTDWPAMSPSPSPWPGLATLITRKHPTGDTPGVHRPDQRLSLDEALPLFTINPAKAMRIDAETGSLTPGKSADVIVLDRDLTAIAPEDIVNTRVVATVFEGRCVHGRLDYAVAADRAPSSA
jgi:predicted amidohydrolase YtcJ